MPLPLYYSALILIFLADIAIFYHFVNHKLMYQPSKSTQILSFVLTYTFYVLASFSAELYPALTLKPFFLLAVIITFVLSFKCSRYKAFIWLFVAFFIQIISEAITLPIISFCAGTSLSNCLNNPYIQLSGFVCSRLLFLFTTEILLRSKKNIFKGFAKEFFIIILFDVIYTLLITSLFYTKNVHITLETASLLSITTILFVSFLALYLLRKMIKKSDEIMHTNLKLQQLEMEHQQNQDMAHIVESLRSLRHDMNNHMSVLHGLLSMGEIADAQDYLESISKDLEVANTFIFTDNKILSVLLNNKISKANALGINLETELLTNTTPFADDELCAVLGNILENAIEANTGHENPHIFFSMKKSTGKLLIQCDNTYTTAPIFEDGQLITTKTNKSYHGIGTQNIRSIVERHHGTVRFSADELFHVDIAIPL